MEGIKVRRRMPSGWLLHVGDYKRVIGRERSPLKRVHATVLICPISL